MRNILLAAAAASVLGTAACGGGATPIDPTEPYPFTASGRVHTLTGAVPAGLQVRVVGTGGPVTSAVAGNGTFAIQAQVTGDSVNVIIDAAPGTARTTLPALIRVAGRHGAPNLNVALVPTQWAIQGGTHHGTVAPISVDAAFRPPCTTPGDTNCDGYYPIEWVRGIKLWQPAMYPIRLVFDHARSHQQITAADSIAFWNAVNLMNTDMGTVLFTPARAAEITFASDGRPNNAVSVRVDTTLVGFGAWTNWWWNSAGDLIAGVVRPRTTTHLRNAGLMTHELLHTQGFKHSCSWPTVMGGYGCGSLIRLSTQDVAHAQVAFEVHGLQRSTGAAHGLLAALQGERVVIHGQPPLTAAAVRRLELPIADLLIQGDSVIHGDHAH